MTQFCVLTQSITGMPDPSSEGLGHGDACSTAGAGIARLREFTQKGGNQRDGGRKNILGSRVRAVEKRVWGGFGG